MKKRIFGLMLVLTIVATFATNMLIVTASSGNRFAECSSASCCTTGSFVGNSAYIPIQPLMVPTNCPMCSRARTLGAVTVGSFGSQSHSFGLAWIHRCNYETAALSRTATCNNSSCFTVAVPIRYSGTRHRLHGRACVSNLCVFGCSSTCSTPNGDSWNSRP